MLDCSATQITIGGTIETPEAMSALLTALDIEGGIDWEHGPPEEGWWDHIKDCAAAGKPLVISVGENPWGVFEEIEAACREHGLAYLRADDGHCTYGPSNVAWRPGMDEPIELHGNIGSGPTVGLAELLKARGEGRLDALLDSYAAAFAKIPPIRLSPAVLAAGRDEETPEEEQEAEAVRKAIEHAEAAENGETDEEVEWNDHGAGDVLWVPGGETGRD